MLQWEGYTLISKPANFGTVWMMCLSELQLHNNDFGWRLLYSYTTIKDNVIKEITFFNDSCGSSNIRRELQDVMVAGK